MSERDELQRLWAEQTTLPLEVDMTKIVQEGRKFERAIRRRNVIELGAAAVVVAVFAFYAAIAEHALARGGAIGVVVGAAFVAALVWRRGREAPLPPDRETAAFVEAYRAGLLRQARLLAWAPLWYVAPLLVPAAVFAAGVEAERTGGAAIPWDASLVLVAVGAAVSAFNLYGAARMRREAARLA